MRRAALLVLPLLAAAGPSAATAAPAPTHAIAMHGEPKYPAGFPHFDYVNPAAPKGGEARLHAIGTFDTLNGLSLRGVPAVGLGGIYDTLLTGSDDEAFTEYGLLAEAIEMPPDRSWVSFRLRPEARWHDGRPGTVEDVAFSLDRTPGPTDHFVFYEDLTSRPEATIGKVIEWLGLGWEPEILERYAGAAGRLITPDEEWKSNVGRRIRRSEAADRSLTSAQRQRVKSLLRHDLYDLLRKRAGVAATR